MNVAHAAVTPDLPLKLGDRGDGVREAQSMLASAGHDPGPIDGIFGPRTENAVESFQAATALPVNGIVNQGTWDALVAAIPDVLMERGDRGADVRSLQQLLKAAGFDPGPIDGIFGGLTENAVEAFQGANGLAVTGKVDGVTLDALSEAADSGLLLERGDRGESVRSLQEKLQSIGFSPGPIDGIFGGLTENAVRAFQRIYGLSGDGVVTQETLDKLDELVPLANSAFSYGYDADSDPDQWRDLVTEVFSQIGLDEEKCGSGDRSGDCIGPQIENAMTIMVCESDGIPMAVNWASGTTGLFQLHPDFWAARVNRARALFPTLPSDATFYNPEHNIMVAALLVHESRDALIGENSLTGPWDDGPEPWGHWVSSSRNCADPPLVTP